MDMTARTVIGSVPSTLFRSDERTKKVKVSMFDKHTYEHTHVDSTHAHTYMHTVYYCVFPVYSLMHMSPLRRKHIQVAR